jgi:hypothetical protein
VVERALVRVGEIAKMQLARTTMHPRIRQHARPQFRD